MKPEQFIRDFGVEKARKVVEGAPDWATHFDLTHKDHYQVEDGEECCLEDLDTVDLSDLKRLVESLDLVEVCGGLVEAKKKMNSESLRSATIEYVLYKAIRDHESIYGGGENA